MAALRNAVADRVLAVAGNVLGTGSRLSLATTMAECPAWDSFGHVELVAAVEEAFGVALDPDEMVAIESLGDLAALIERRLA